ncbi:MAG: MFS transporter [Microcella sp.]|nr:MFS transporter [Microcella sp.]
MHKPKGAWGGRVAAMATIAATGVAVIYIPQPIQTLVADEFGVSGSASAGATIAVQAGYALGVVLLVSLGDRYSARRQVTVQLVATAAALGMSAASPHYALFVALAFIAGATATVGQLLVSAALRLAPPAARARTAAVLLGSLIVGLFTVRTALGSVAELIGWRGAVLACALVVLALVPLSLRFSPPDSPSDPPAYRRILASIPRIAAGSPTLRLMTAVHVLCFMAFIALWSMTTVYAVDELELSVAQASLIGLAGLAGGVLTISGASLHARIGASRSLAICIAAALAGAVLVAVAPGSLPLLLVGLFLVSAGMSSEQVSTQAIALASVDSSENGRANTVFMAATFLGGSVATAVASQLVTIGGYAAVGVMSVAFVVAAAALSAVAKRRGMLEPSAR